MQPEEVMPTLAHLVDCDSMRIDVGMAFSASKGAIRTVTLYEPQYSARNRWGTPVLDNLSIEGCDESVPALLRGLADMFEKAQA